MWGMGCTEALGKDLGLGLPHDPKSSHFLLPQQPYCHRACCNAVGRAEGPAQAPTPLLGTSMALALSTPSSFLLSRPDFAHWRGHHSTVNHRVQ